jgi:hypothetical protein
MPPDEELELEDELEDELDDELEAEVDVELEEALEDELADELEAAPELDAELDAELEDELDDELDAELEDELEAEVELLELALLLALVVLLLDAAVVLELELLDEPATHAFAVHAWPAVQSALVLHCTQPPPPLQTLPPSEEQGVPAGADGCSGMPAVQAPVTQSLDGGGALLSSATVFVPPRPSHTTLWQLPAVCIEMGVPAFAYAVPQVPLVQVGCSQSVIAPGHWLASVHGPVPLLDVVLAPPPDDEPELVEPMVVVPVLDEVEVATPPVPPVPTVPPVPEDDEPDVDELELLALIPPVPFWPPCAPDDPVDVLELVLAPLVVRRSVPYTAHDATMDAEPATARSKAERIASTLAERPPRVDRRPAANPALSRYA